MNAEINGKKGIVEYIVNGAGKLTHQLFKTGAKIDGKRN